MHCFLSGDNIMPLLSEGQELPLPESLGLKIHCVSLFSNEREGEAAVCLTWSGATVCFTGRFNYQERDAEEDPLPSHFDEGRIRHEVPYAHLHQTIAFGDKSARLLVTFLTDKQDRRWRWVRGTINALLKRRKLPLRKEPILALLVVRQSKFSMIVRFVDIKDGKVEYSVPGLTT